MIFLLDCGEEWYFRAGLTDRFPARLPAFENDYHPKQGFFHFPFTPGNLGGDLPPNRCY
jgi:hypothetical protein